MDKKELDVKIAEATRAILSYCMARTPDQYEAEDLAQDIILEIYKSAANIRNEDAFYGFLWSVANNVYKQWYRKRLHKKEEELTENLADKSEELFEEDSDVYLLRRELSLLAEKYRRATILYYMENKSCSEISQMLSISESMVKYLLFKSRQILKEGMNMERNYGQQSYQPKSFSFRYWGEEACDINPLCGGKIAQNILFACYNDKLTAEQISLEIGVALPYMEDSLRALYEEDYLKKDGNKYYTNLTIFTKEFAEEVGRKTVNLKKSIADKVKQTLEEKIALTYPKDKSGKEYFLWGVEEFEQEVWQSQFSFGTACMNNEQGDRLQCMDIQLNGEMVHHYFFNRRNLVNIFLDIAKGNVSAFSQNDKACVADMIKRGYVLCSETGELSVNAPVFTKEQIGKLQEILEEAAETIASEAEEMLGVIAGILQNHVPVHLKKTAENLAYLCLFEDAVSAPISILCKNGFYYHVKVIHSYLPHILCCSKWDGPRKFIPRVVFSAQIQYTQQ